MVGVGICIGLCVGVGIGIGVGIGSISQHLASGGIWAGSIWQHLFFFVISNPIEPEWDWVYARHASASTRAAKYLGSFRAERPVVQREDPLKN